jgi:hypothetical protein
MARRTLAARLDEVRAEQRKAMLQQQKALVARKLAEDRRAARPVKKKKAFGTHLEHLARLLPGQQDVDDKESDMRLTSPLQASASFSTRWLTNDQTIPQSQAPYQMTLSQFQEADIQHVRAEYQYERATTPSHMQPTWTQVNDEAV